MTACTCRGYDPADPCGHGDTSEGCPRHDPALRFCGFCDDYATGWIVDDYGDRYGYCPRHREEVASLID